MTRFRPFPRRLCACLVFFLFTHIASAVLPPGHPLLGGVVIGSGSFSYKETVYPLDDHHLLLAGSATEQTVADNPFVFKTFQEASRYFKDGTPDRPMVLYIAPYVYWIDDPDDATVAMPVDGRGPFGMTVTCQNLHLVGLTDNPSEVVLASQRGQTQGAVGNFTMFDFWGDGLEVTNLTMGNYCNVDLDYPLLPALSRPRRSTAITQAHVAYCHGDRVIARNVRFISRLNMNPINGARRVLYDHCHMECTDDALTGNGVYLHCDFDFYGQKPFYTTHPAGAVLIDCDLHLLGGSDRAYFCKAPGQVTLIDCRIHARDGMCLDWTPYPHRWTRCYQAGVTMNGQPYTIGAARPEHTVVVDGKPLAQRIRVNGGYSVAHLLAGDDGWNPLGEPWDANTDLPSCLRVSPAVDTLAIDAAPLLLKAEALRHGGYPMPTETLSWQVEQGKEGYVKLHPLSDGTCRVESCYDGDTVMSCVVTATAPCGLVGAAEIRLKGRQWPAPLLIRKPRLRVDATEVTLSYEADMGGKADRSLIDWYRCSTRDGSDAVLVSTGRQAPHYRYRLTEADEGRYIMAVIRPKSVRSVVGAPCAVVTRKRIGKGSQAPLTQLHTDFSDFPADWQERLLPGCWTVDGFKPADTAPYDWSFSTQQPMWVYGEGFNGAVGYGLMQAQKGARLRYTPLEHKVGDMRLSLLVDPAKTAGQGFGSATGQYMDVCVKMDTESLTGYGLRIERTVKYANAVDFQLVAYHNGVVTPLSDAVSAVCYRTGCRIRVEYVSGCLTADVTTDTPLERPADSNLLTEVHLSAHVADSGKSGLLIQHTGSCGESVTMLHDLQVVWP